MIKVLWLANTSGLLQKVGSNYNGCGWIASLQQAVIDSGADIELAICYPTDGDDTNSTYNGCKYFPIKKQKLSGISKLKYYYWGYKKKVNNYNDKIKRVIDDFKPDIIHLFGLENYFNEILLDREVSTPIIVHLQGLLLPYFNAFWPSGFSKKSFLWPPTKSEWIFHNGLIYAKNSVNVRANRERLLFRNMHYAMGRTDWDKSLTNLLSDSASYFHVDEVLRPEFYESAGHWLQRSAKSKNSKKIVFSLISATAYKGLDLILKTAKELKTKDIDFEWRIAGIANNSSFITYFERQVKIKSADVNITYCGVVDPKGIIDNIMNADVFVHPSYIDNSPNSLCEAQMLGIPVVATDVGGISSLVQNNQTGILVPANSPFYLASKIVSVFGDNSKSNGLAIRGFQEALKRHDRESIIKQLMNAYTRTIQNC